MSRPTPNNAPPTPPATPPPKEEDPSEKAVTDNLTRTVGKGALHHGLAGGLGTLALGPIGGLVGGLVGVIYGSSLASTEGVREKYQPNGWAGNGVPPAYYPADNTNVYQKKFGIQNGGFPHGLPSQRKKQNPRTENIQRSSQKRTSSSPGPQPERATRQTQATPRSTLNNSSSFLSNKRITSMTPLPPVPKMDAPSTVAPSTVTPRPSPYPSPSASPQKRITSLSPIPKINAPAPSTSTTQAKTPPAPQTQRKTLPSTPRPQTAKAKPKNTPQTPKATPFSPPPANTAFSTPILPPMPAAPAPAARGNPGRRRRKGGANGSESSGSQAGDASQERKLSIIDTYLS